MPFTLTWSDITVRLVGTLIAGILVGIDRDEKGRAEDVERVRWQVAG